MRYPTIVFVAIGVVAGLSSPLDAEVAEVEPPAPQPRRAWVEGEIEVPSRYYFRGFALERNRRGAIVQPAVKIGMDLWRPEEGPINQVSAVVGMRNSFHSRKTGASGTGPSNWFESDLVAGTRLQLFERLHGELVYVAITSPSGAFPSIQEINLDWRYDDLGLWGEEHGFALHPQMNLKFEIDGSAAGGPRGTLVQLGLEPGFMLFEREPLPLRLSFPMEVGLSLNDYYFLPDPPASGRDNTYGYAKVGVSLTMPLFFVPVEYGQWAVTVGADYINLGENLTTFNQGRRDDIIGRVSLRFRF